MAKISEDELDDIKERYELYDKKGDGKIDCAQIINVLRACGLNPLKPDVDKVRYHLSKFLVRLNYFK